jgi:parallel beta-helix repeat protein
MIFVNIEKYMEKKKIIILLSAFLFLIIIHPVFANTITVCSSGCDYTTIQGGINAASSGDEVRITDSLEYNESITINKSIILTSNSTTMPTIWNNLTHVINISYNNITISNLNIKQNSSSTNRYAIFNTTSNNNITIVNNFINISGGTYNYAVYLRLTNSNISYNNITTFSYSGYGIYLAQSSNNNISSNNITTKDSYGYGIYLVTNSNNNNISSNNITTESSYGYGIYLYASSDNNNITSNNITIKGTTSHGIYLYVSSNITLTNNNITIPTVSNGGLGLYIYGTSIPYFIHEIDESNIVNNMPIKYLKYISDQVIADNHTWSTLIIASSNNITITNTTVSPQGMIQISNLTNSNISYNNITTFSYSGYGIYLAQSSNNNITNNNITTSGNDCNGIYLAQSSNNNISSNKVTNEQGGNSYALYLYSSSNNNNITSNNITTKCSNCYGIYLYLSSNNNISSNNITTTNLATSGHGIYFYNSGDNRVINTNISTIAGTSYAVYIRGTSVFTNYLINSTYDKSKIQPYSATQGTKLFNQYYLDVYVNDALGDPINEVAVNTTDSNTYTSINPTPGFNKTTNSSGYIQQQILTEFMTNGTYNRTSGYLYFNNYTLDASKTGYLQNSTQVNLTNSQFITLTLGTQNIILEVNLSEPSTEIASNIIQNHVFTVNATVFCREGSCDYVNGTILYNLTSEYPDTAINTSSGDKPFFIDELEPLAMKSCPTNPLDENEFCNLTWIVNASGDPNTDWKIGVIFNSSTQDIEPNSTDNATVSILPCTTDFDVSWNYIQFGDIQLDPNTFNNSAIGNTNNEYNISINYGSCNLDLYIRGDDLINETYNSVIKVGNISWSNISGEIDDGYFTLSSVNSPLKLDVPENTNFTTWYWLNVPPTYFGYYNSTIYITGVKNGENP